VLHLPSDVAIRLLVTLQLHRFTKTSHSQGKLPDLGNYMHLLCHCDVIHRAEF